MRDGPTDPPSAAHRLPSVDGLRAVSIGMVLASHASLTRGFPRAGLWWVAHGVDGQMGVRVFFVISGFLITHLMAREEARTGRVSLAGFYRRRAVRILPVYWTFLAVVALLTWTGRLPGTLVYLLQPLTFTTGYWPARVWSFGHTWSLSVEEQFYLVWPVAFVWAGRRAGRRALVAAAVLVAAPLGRVGMHFAHWWGLMGWTILGHGDAIGWGCLLAVLVDRRPAWVDRCVRWRPAVGRAAAVAVVVVATAADRRPHLGLVIVPLAVPVTSAAIAYVLASVTRVPSGWSYRALNWPPVARLGVLSYGIYLWQELLLFPDGPAVDGHPWQWWPWNVPVAVAVAIASYALVERPLMRFKRPAPAAGAEAVPRDA